jgi:hypothetical protein
MNLIDTAESKPYTKDFNPTIELQIVTVVSPVLAPPRPNRSLQFYLYLRVIITTHRFVSPP